MFLRKYRAEIIFSLVITCLIIFTIVYGNHLAAKGIKIRQWTWYNLIILVPFVVLVFSQRWLGLPPIATINQKPKGWLSTLGVGAIFGLLDVIVVKFILHPEPYTELPPSFQVFPYSIFLYSSGAIDVEFYNRMLPLALILLINKFVFRGNYRNYFIVFAGVVTSIVEPIQQFPEGATWFIIYATVSGLMMNAWQFMGYMKYGFIASLSVRWGHYLIWHILLGLYIEWIELAG